VKAEHLNLLKEVIEYLEQDADMAHTADPKNYPTAESAWAYGAAQGLKEILTTNNGAIVRPVVWGDLPKVATLRDIEWVEAILTSGYPLVDSDLTPMNKAPDAPKVPETSESK